MAETLVYRVMFRANCFGRDAVRGGKIQGRRPQRFSGQSVPVHQSRFPFALSLLVPFRVHFSRLPSSRTALRSSRVGLGSTSLFNCEHLLYIRRPNSFSPKESRREKLTGVANEIPIVKPAV